jgi:hypothetical protein
VIVTREGLECHHPVEFEYYSNPKLTTTWFDAKLCAYCAGSSEAKGFLDEHLTIEWKSVLPICQQCRADGAIPLARTKRRNGEANGHRARRDRLMTAAVTQPSENVVTPAEAADIPPSRTSTTSRTSKRGRRVDSALVASRPRRLWFAKCVANDATRYLSYDGAYYNIMIATLFSWQHYMAA